MLKFNFKNLFIVSVTLSLFLNLSCDTSDPPTPPETKATLTLALEDTSCTEVRLKLTTKDLTLPAELTLKQYTQTGDSLSQNFVLNTQDSMLYIDSLLPNQSFSFQVSSIQHQASSNELTVTTMDTTSHNFTWQTFTWGNSGSSLLRDVAIINENDIWAVGEIKIADSSLIGYTQYNAVHWNGINWEFKRIMFYYNCGQPDDSYSFGIRSIFVINTNEIWVAMDGDQIAKIENGVQTETLCMPYNFSIKKMWGTSSNDLYIVGYLGNIAHYDGTNWNRIESGTTLNINDIWGDYNQKTQEWEILAACGNYLHGYENERAIVRILNNNTATLLNATGSKWPLIGVWFKAGKKYYVNGAGIYRTKILGSEWIGAPLEFTEYTTQRIRGNDINDLVASGDFGDLLHFNGYNWQSYISQTYLPNGTLLSVDIKRNVVVATGWISQQAVLIIGQR